MQRKARGFSLIELMVTLGVLLISTTVGLPALAGLLEHQRSAAALGALTTQMQLARMAAITYRQPALLCPSRDGADCDGGADWSGGWIVFLDRDGNRRVDAGDEIIRAETAPTSRQLQVQATTGRPHVRYLPDGRSAGSNLTISVCNRDGQLLGAVIVNNAGRPRVSRPVAGTPCPSQG